MICGPQCSHDLLLPLFTKYIQLNQAFALIDAETLCDGKSQDDRSYQWLHHTHTRTRASAQQKTVVIAFKEVIPRSAIVLHNVEWCNRDNVSSCRIMGVIGFDSILFNHTNTYAAVCHVVPALWIQYVVTANRCYLYTKSSEF